MSVQIFVLASKSSSIENSSSQMKQRVSFIMCVVSNVEQVLLTLDSSGFSAISDAVSDDLCFWSLCNFVLLYFSLQTLWNCARLLTKMDSTPSPLSRRMSFKVEGISPSSLKLFKFSASVLYPAPTSSLFDLAGQVGFSRCHFGTDNTTTNQCLCLRTPTWKSLHLS